MKVKNFELVTGKKFKNSAIMGTPLTWEIIE